MKYFVVFKKQEKELVNAYSIVDFGTLQSISKNVILGKKKLEGDPNGLSKLDLEVVRNEIINEHNK